MFNQERLLTKINADTGKLDWYFNSPLGEIGPFSNECLAKSALEMFTQLKVSDDTRIQSASKHFIKQAGCCEPGLSPADFIMHGLPDK